MTDRFDTYVPRPGYSVRPPDLSAHARSHLGPGVPAASAAQPDGEGAAETAPIVEVAPAVAAPPGARTTPSVAAPAPHPPPAQPAPAPQPAPDGGPPQKRSGLRRLVEIPLLVGAALLFAFLIKAFLVQAFYIPSASMVPALEVGDRVLVEKISYRFRDPQRGEIIVFERPGATVDGGVATSVRAFFEDLGLVRPQDDIALIKRVLGLPGETIEIREGRLWVDGRLLVEDTVVPDGRSFPPFTVPEDSYYLLGDNRSNSDDSRYSLGAVPRDEVVGRAFVVLWPPDNASTSLRTHYAGGDTATDITDDGPSAPAVSPPALPQPDALEAPPS